MTDAFDPSPPPRAWPPADAAPVSILAYVPERSGPMTGRSAISITMFLGGTESMSIWAATGEDASAGGGAARAAGAAGPRREAPRRAAATASDAPGRRRAGPGSWTVGAGEAGTEPSPARADRWGGEKGAARPPGA